MAGTVDYLAADNFNHVPVSAANPLPTTSASGGAAVSTANPLPVANAALPVGAVPLAVSSGNVANASAVATLPAAVGKTTYIKGFTITPGGVTVAAVVTATLTGVANTLSYTIGAPTGAGAAGPAVVVPFGDGIPASAVNTAIVLTLPALGGGNLNASVTAWGYQL